ncbi:MAG: regulatory protein RecX [Saprospiraceae bacterium]
MAWQRNNSLNKQRSTPDQALKKLERYCSYQDRCHQEVRRKLYDVGLYGEDVDHVMAKLIETSFLDEERFARSYARGKFRMKKWGRIRIQIELRSRQISKYCMKAAMQELEEYDYEGTLKKLLEKRYEKQKSDLHPYAKRQDLITFGMRKGYEIDIIKSVITEVIPS